MMDYDKLLVVLMRKKDKYQAELEDMYNIHTAPEHIKLCARVHALEDLIDALCEAIT